MRGHFRHRLTLLLVLLTGLPWGLAAKEVPPLRARVNDYAELLPVEVEARIEGKLEAFEGQTGAQIAVLTVDSLEGEVLEDYSLRVVETWQLGRRDVDDGVLLLVAVGDRKMRIEVGYGLEGELTDAQSAAIVRNILRPQFRNGDFAGGIEKGVDAILGTLQGLDVIPSAGGSGGDFQGAPLGARLMGVLIFTVVVGLFSLVAVFGSGCGSWFLYFFLMPFYLAFPSAFFGPTAGFGFFATWLILFPVLKFWLGNTGAGKTFRGRHPGLFDFATSGGRSGGWSGGGGFSGGGGSFGGGGASGSW
jgi:uncharacterized protein